MKRTDKYPYIIAEIGCNHNGDVSLAKQMLDEAKVCGANAAKVQLWSKEELFTDDYLKDLDSGRVRLENVKEFKTKEMGLNNVFDQVKKFAIYEKEHIELFKYARKIGIDYASTVVTKRGVDFLIDQKVSFLKVASMDTNHPEFLEYIISKNYPTIISTGMATLAEIEMIVDLIPTKFRKNFTLLHCVSLYPPKDNIVHLNFIPTLKRLFDIRIGYSDHTLGFSVPLAAVALGAEVIEKHFTLDKDMPGWDHKVSANPQEMRMICHESRRIVDALGDARKTLSPMEQEKRLKFRRSIISTRTIIKGKQVTLKDITFKRPGTGIAPSEWKYVLGRVAKRDIQPDKTISWKDLI